MVVQKILYVRSGVATRQFSRYTSFKLLSSFISLQTDCFHTQLTQDICLAGLNRQAG